MKLESARIAHDTDSAQLVNTGKTWSDAIMKTLNWKEDMYKKGLRELKKCGAIKHVGRRVYQINPNYAGKGEWKYNPKLERGGVENLTAEFDFANKTVKINIIYAADRENPLNTDIDKIFLNGIDPKKQYEQIVLRKQIPKIRRLNHEKCADTREIIYQSGKTVAVKR